MRTHQTLAFSQRMSEKYSFENGPRSKMSIREAFRELETYVDSSDPDVSLPNLIHMLQTAEGIRKAGHPEWFQVVGLIHDMGKIMFL
jgi:inositol oxygenase